MDGRRRGGGGRRVSVGPGRGGMENGRKRWRESGRKNWVGGSAIDIVGCFFVSFLFVFCQIPT